MNIYSHQPCSCKSQVHASYPCTIGVVSPTCRLSTLSPLQCPAHLYTSAQNERLPSTPCSTDQKISPITSKRRSSFPNTCSISQKKG